MGVTHIAVSVFEYAGNDPHLTGRFFAPKAKIWLKAYEDKRVKIQKWFQKYGALVIVFESFIYGTHIPALLTVGMSDIPITGIDSKTEPKNRNERTTNTTTS